MLTFRQCTDSNVIVAMDGTSEVTDPQRVAKIVEQLNAYQARTNSLPPTPPDQEEPSPKSDQA